MAGVVGRLPKLVAVAFITVLIFGAGVLARDASIPTTLVSRESQAAAVASNVNDLQSALVAAAEKVRPAVVSVRTESGLGSGVIYDTGGLVLTNAHVVNGARTISVMLLDGRRFSAQVLGADAGFDLAVLRIQGDNLPVATLGDSANLRPGEFVIAIGNPYGFNYSVTSGVVSAINRPISEGQDAYNQPMVQTDAAINPGNSGGPLVDLEGKVVGINTLVAAPEGFPAQGLGFAIPVSTVKRIAPQLASDGRVTHSGQPYLGVSLTNGGAGPARGGNRGSQGAVIAQVIPGGPAAQAGLRQGDVITQLNDAAVTSADDLLAQLVLTEPGASVKMTVERQDGSRTLEVRVGEAPPR